MHLLELDSSGPVSLDLARASHSIYHRTVISHSLFPLRSLASPRLHLMGLIVYPLEVSSNQDREMFPLIARNGKTSRLLSFLLLGVILALVLVCTQGCVASPPHAPSVDGQTGTDQNTAAKPTASATANANQLQDTEIIAAQSQHARQYVTVSALVKRLLKDDTKGIPHQRFLIELSNGTTVLVAHNTDRAPRVPVQQGDIVTIHGEYIWTEKGGTLHWTHHSDSPMHEGGWIEFNGQRYQ